MFNLKWTQLYVSLVWAMSSYIANCVSLPVCAWRYGTLLTLKCKTSPDRASVILLIKEETLKSNFVLECELMAMNGNVMQRGFFIWHRKGYEFIQMSKNFFPNVDSIAPHYLKWLSWQIVKPYLVSCSTLEWKKMLLCNNIHTLGRANLPFSARLKPKRWLYLANTFLAPAPRGVAALVTVSDDNTQITLLILMRGALSSQTSQTKRLQAKLRDFFSFPPSQLIIAAMQVVSIQ